MAKTGLWSLKRNTITLLYSNWLMRSPLYRTRSHHAGARFFSLFQNKWCKYLINIIIQTNGLVVDRLPAIPLVSAWIVFVRWSKIYWTFCIIHKYTTALHFLIQLIIFYDVREICQIEYLSRWIINQSII